MSGSFCVKIKSKNGQQILKDLHNDMTLNEFIKRVAEITQIHETQLHILNGFPPRPLDLTRDLEKTIAAAGIRSGEILIVEEKPNGTITPVSTKATSSETNATKQTQYNSQLEEDEALARRLQAEEDEEQLRQLASENHVEQPTVRIDEPQYDRSEPVHYNGILLKKVVPADNSCLFTSIRFVLNGKIDNEGSEMMRHIIAQEVAADPQQYNDAVLGKSNAEYCAWIQKPDSWGGAIEVAILSNYYGLEIDVVDIQNAIINRFGEDKNYGLRVFLLFDGIHYDPLYLETMSGGVPATIFPIEEMGVYQQAEQLANEAKSARQFTNVDKFTLRCIQCDVMLVGQVQAQEHAKTTGHTNFSEI